jgi:hypothetical protein
MVALDFPDAPTDGQDFGVWEWSDSVDAWRWNVVPSPYEFEYVVVAGGGGGGGPSGGGAAGGGGAGGYRSSVSGESSGGGASAETALSLSAGTYTVTVGAGGANQTQGVASVFSTVSTLAVGVERLKFWLPVAVVLVVEAQTVKPLALLEQPEKVLTAALRRLMRVLAVVVPVN